MIRSSIDTIIGFIDWLIATCSSYQGAASVLVALVLAVTLVFGIFGRLFVFERDDDDIRNSSGSHARAEAAESRPSGSDTPSPA